VIKAVAILPVKGNGSKELTAAMRAAFEVAGWPVLKAKRKDAVNIQGTVKIADTATGMQRVSLIWLVTTPSGKRLGDVKQDNDVPAGSLAQGWGDNADAAAQAAAEGIAKLIQQYR
jgi:hypothetical protein